MIGVAFRLLAGSPSAVGIVALISALVGAAPATFIGYKLGHAAGYRAGFRAGGDDMARQVERVNAKAAEAARKVRSTIDDCYARGGNWSQESGTCDR